MRGIESGNEVADQPGANERMIDQAEQHSVNGRRKTLQSGVDGTELALLPIRVDDNFVRGDAGGASDGFGMRAKYDATHADLG